jgi:hypothetical protein
MIPTFQKPILPPSSWWRRQHGSLKRWQPTTTFHDVTTQKTLNSFFCISVVWVCSIAYVSQVKVIPVLFNWAPRHESVLGELRYSFAHSLTSALDGGEWSASRPDRFTPKERAPGTHWIGGSVGPRAVLDLVVKRKIPSPRRESNPRTPIVQSVAQRHTDWAITALQVLNKLIPLQAFVSEISLTGTNFINIVTTWAFVAVWLSLEQKLCNISFRKGVGRLGLYRTITKPLPPQEMRNFPRRSVSHLEKEAHNYFGSNLLRYKTHC